VHSAERRHIGPQARPTLLQGAAVHRPALACRALLRYTVSHFRLGYHFPKASVGERRQSERSRCARSAGDRPKTKDSYESRGFSFPPADWEKGLLSAEWWQLPAESFVSLRGLPRRAFLRLYFELVVLGRLADLPLGSVMLVHAERSLLLGQPHRDTATVVTASQKAIVVQHGVVGWRISWLSPREIFRLQGMRLKLQRSCTGARWRIPEISVPPFRRNR
jgi:hypothetical protein